MKKKIRLMAFFWLLQHTLSAQPVVDFSVSSTSGCAPMAVNFTDLSSGNPTQWHWDFGNGTSSTLRNPAVSYLYPGAYTIKLTVWNSRGSDSVIRTGLINVFPQPQNNFSTSSQSGCAPFIVNFTDSSHVAGGSIANWLWDFGDGNFSSQQNPTHIYLTPGVFNVSLRTISDIGCSRTITRPFHIRVFDTVKADFHIASQNSCLPPAVVNFVNNSTGNGPLTYNWSFGDGENSTVTNPSHTYTGNGTYNVSLIVKNSNGCADTFSVPGAVNLGARQTRFNASGPLCVTNTIHFTNTSSPLPQYSFWYFGDGDTSSLPDPEHFYNAPGTYSVKLVNDFGGCKDSVTQQITINTKPVAAFNTNDTVACKSPHTATFINRSTNGISYSWDFGDGGTSIAQNPIHTYQQEGRFSVRLITTSRQGCADTIIKSEYVRIILPEASIDSLPQRGCAPFTWTFRSRLISIQPTASYYWDFGDGQTSTAPTPTHTFDSGNYTIRLIVVTSGGCTDTVIVTNGIRVGVRPTANFIATPLNACANTPIEFIDSSRGNATNWHWYFGDGGSSILQNPTYRYTDTGYFTVRLVISNFGCNDTLTIEDYIHIKPPIAIINMEFNCTEKYKRNFIGSRSIGADSYEWNFGDGSSSNSPDPVHTYQAAGTYLVTLRVTNNETGCFYEQIKTVSIIDETADFNALQNEICKNTPVAFSSINSDPSKIASYLWYYGEGSTGTGRDTVFSYPVAGSYDVKLVITDLLGCKDSITKTQFIRINGPTADLGVSENNVCFNNQVTFTSLSTSDGQNPIVSYTWYFGNGISLTTTTPGINYTYPIGGLFTVGLRVTDSKGCTDSKSIRNLIRVSRPRASFVTLDSVFCPGIPVHFTNRSTGSGLRYLWDFGNGSTDTTANPSHNYNQDGSYTIRLEISDRFGCRDSLIRNQYIRIVNGEASFHTNDTFSLCPPLVARFINNSRDAASYSWDFGDGTGSSLTNPFHFYTEAGIYDVVLTARSISGCLTRFTRKIIVRGPSGTFNYNPLSGCNPLRINFQAQTRNCNSILWDFADGNTVVTTDTTVTHTYLSPGNYLPRIILMNNDGCRVPVMGSDSIRVNGSDVSFSIDKSVVCGSGHVQFSNSSYTNDTATRFEWNFGDGHFSSDQNPLHYYNSIGEYYPELTVFTSSGCRDSLRATEPIRISTVPSIEIQKGPNSCAPAAISMSAILLNPDTNTIRWYWNFGNGVTDTTSNPGTINYDNAGNYSVFLTASNGYGCSDTVISTISAYPEPLVFAGPDTFSCLGRGIRLTATGNAAQYEWSPGRYLSCTNCPETRSNPDSSITYFLKGTSEYGCIKRDSVHVKVYRPLDMKASNGDSICKGESIFMFAQGAHSYIWNPSVTSIRQDNSVVSSSPLNSTIFRVTGTDEVNCFSQTLEIPVNVFPIPTVEAGENKTISAGNSVDLFPAISPDVTEVYWTPTGSIFRSSYPGISVKPRETTEYKVKVLNANGCSATDNLTVYVTCDGANVFIPNTFTPNSDGMNDVFYPRGRGLHRIKSMKIFNRWGEQIFARNDFQPNANEGGWNGTYKGKPLNPDVYVYVIEILCENNSSLLYKGNIALLK